MAVSGHFNHKHRFLYFACLISIMPFANFPFEQLKYFLTMSCLLGVFPLPARPIPIRPTQRPFPPTRRPVKPGKEIQR